MIRLRFLILALLLVGIGRADWQEVQSVKPGAPILVVSGFVTDAGKFVRSTTDSLSIETRAGEVTLAKDDIDEVVVFRSRTDRIRSGLLWGGVAAAATAAVLFPMTARLSNPHYGASSAVTASNGAAIGVGRYVSSKTKRIYRRTN
jgi:hypothetical protein